MHISDYHVYNVNFANTVGYNHSTLFFILLQIFKDIPGTKGENNYYLYPKILEIYKYRKQNALMHLCAAKIHPVVQFVLLEI